MCGDVSMGMEMCVFAGAFAVVHGGQRLMLGVIVNHSSPYVVRQGLSLNLEITHLVSLADHEL